MADLEQITRIAEKVLTSRDGQDGLGGSFLFDLACRLARNCEMIAQLQEVRRFQIDLDCLRIAAMFIDAGVIESSPKKGAARRNATGELTGRALREASVAVVRRELDRTIDSGQCERICNIMVEAESAQTLIVEARILADARNLDEVGAVGLFNELRRGSLEGRGVGDMLRAWQRKSEYGYWSARLRQGFRFESVRRIAESRLGAAEQFMRQLQAQHDGDDIRGELVGVNPSGIEAVSGGVRQAMAQVD